MSLVFKGSTALLGRTAGGRGDKSRQGTPGKYELAKNDQIVEQLVRPTGLLDPIIEVRPAVTQVDDLFDEIQLVVARDERILVNVLTKRMVEDLTDYVAEHYALARYLHSDIATTEGIYHNINKYL